MAQRVPALARKLGLDGDALCRRHGLEPAALRDRTARIPLDPVLASLETILSESGHPSLGLELAVSGAPEAYHTPGLLLMASDTLRSGFARAFAFQRLWGDGDRFALVSPSAVGQVGEGLAVVFSIPGRRRTAHGILEVCALVETMRGVRALTGRHDAMPLSVGVPSTTDDLDTLRDFFGTSVEVGTTRAFVHLSDAILDAPLLHAHAMFSQIFERQASAELEALQPEDDILATIEAELSRGLAKGRSSLEETARSLGVSARTLERRLSDHGVRYQDVMNRVRKERALSLLRQGLTIDEVAVLLGYAERSSFHRACVRWFNKTPAQLQGGHGPHGASGAKRARRRPT